MRREEVEDRKQAVELKRRWLDRRREGEQQTGWRPGRWTEGHVQLRPSISCTCCNFFLFLKGRWPFIEAECAAAPPLSGLSGG